MYVNIPVYCIYEGNKYKNGNCAKLLRLCPVNLGSSRWYKRNNNVMGDSYSSGLDDVWDAM